MRLLTLMMFCSGGGEIGKSAFPVLKVKDAIIGSKKCGANIVGKGDVKTIRTNIQKQMRHPRNNCW